MAILNSEGRFDATVKTCELGESQNGTPFIQFGFETTDGDVITAWQYFSAAAQGRTFKVLEEVFEFDINSDETIENQCLGKDCSIVCGFEDDNKGNERLRVQWINPVRQKPKEIEGEEQFRKDLKAQFLDWKSTQGTDPAKAAAAKAAADQRARKAAAAKAELEELKSDLDEDVPF
jgi:hypothetical protein